MTVRINGAARGGEFISSNLQFYIMYTNIDITQTGSYSDDTQKDFDSIVQMIAMFSQVIISNDPVNVSDLNANGAPTLTGAGYVFKFAVEHPDVFADNGDPLGKLTNSMNGVVLNGGTLATTGTVNIEFTQSETL
jgi:hypothetical protein|tara:strand:- start:25518 stop:25922 length:405 start_codon:yes stop_codon:yes gene_type:complete